MRLKNEKQYKAAGSGINGFCCDFEDGGQKRTYRKINRIFRRKVRQLMKKVTRGKDI